MVHEATFRIVFSFYSEHLGRKLELGWVGSFERLTITRMSNNASRSSQFSRNVVSSVILSMSLTVSIDFRQRLAKN